MIGTTEVSKAEAGIIMFKDLARLPFANPELNRRVKAFFDGRYLNPCYEVKSFIPTYEEEQPISIWIPKLSYDPQEALMESYMANDPIICEKIAEAVGTILSLDPLSASEFTSLTEFDQEIIEVKYGFTGYVPTVEEAARIVGLTRSQYYHLLEELWIKLHQPSRLSCFNLVMKSYADLVLNDFRLMRAEVFER